MTCLNPRISSTAKTFSPANLRAASADPRYNDLIQYYISHRYTLRYSGGLVPDIHHLLIKGEGVFLSPVHSSAPAKLRLLYECFAIAFIVENCGGSAVDDTGLRILDRIGDFSTKCGFCAGSNTEVNRFIQTFKQTKQ